MPSAGGPKSYWLIVPAAAQPVEVLPGQVMMIYPAVQPQLLFAAGASHAPVMTRLASGVLGFMGRGFRSVVVPCRSCCLQRGPAMLLS
jgi:hypothetical protein